MDRRTLLQVTGAVLGIAAAPPALALRGTVRLVVVVGQSSPLTNIELGDLRRLFSGEPVGDTGGKKLIPLNHPARTPDRVGFDRTVLGMGPDEVAKFWVDRKIRGESEPPRTVTSLNVLLGVVSRLAGAIGYVRPQYMNEGVRALKVSGKAPGSSDYPLFYTE